MGKRSKNSTEKCHCGNTAAKGCIMHSCRSCCSSRIDKTTSCDKHEPYAEETCSSCEIMLKNTDEKNLYMCWRFNFLFCWKCLSLPDIDAEFGPYKWEPFIDNAIG